MFLPWSRPPEGAARLHDEVSVSKQKRATLSDSKAGEVAGRESPGDITKLALAAREGDLEALRILTTRVTKELHRVAQEHLYPQGELRLSATQLSRMVIHQFALASDINLQSRRDFFAFAEKEIQRLVEQIKRQGHLLAPGQEAYAGLQALFRGKTRKKNPVAFGLALGELQRTNPDLARVLHLHYFLGLERREVATWLGRVESDFAHLWDEAQAILRGHYHQISKAGSSKDSLDSSISARYSAKAHLTPSSLPETSDSPPASPELVASLRAEVADLQAKLAAAQERIVALEQQEKETGPDTSTVRADIDFLLRPIALADVPLCTATHLDDLWSHLETHYGQWLAHFGADRNYISLDQIRDHDPEFVKKLTHRISRLRAREKKQHGEAKTPTLSEIMPTESDRGDLALTSLTITDLFDPAIQELAVLVVGRLRRHLYGQ